MQYENDFLLVWLILVILHADFVWLACMACRELFARRSPMTCSVIYWNQHIWTRSCLHCWSTFSRMKGLLTYFTSFGRK